MTTSFDSKNIGGGAGMLIGHAIHFGVVLSEQLHRGPLKRCHFNFYDNFGKCGPISIILSLLDS